MRKSRVMHVRRYAWIFLLLVLSYSRAEALHIGHIELLSKKEGTPFLARLSLSPRHNENLQQYEFHAVLRDMSRVPSSEVPLKSSIFREDRNWFLRLTGGPFVATHAASVRILYADVKGRQHSFSVFLHPTPVAQVVSSAGVVPNHVVTYSLLDHRTPANKVAAAPASLQVARVGAVPMDGHTPSTITVAMPSATHNVPSAAKNGILDRARSPTDTTPVVASNTSVATNFSGQTVTLTQPILIAQLAKMHRVPDISDTRMAAYIHLFNPTLHFSWKIVGLIQAGQVLYLPSVAEVMALNQQLWNSYKKMIVDHVRRTTRTRSFVLSSQGQVAYGHTASVVVPTILPVRPHGNRVRVDRAVLSRKLDETAGVEERIAQKVSDEQSQAQLKDLDTKINRLMADVAKREQRLKQEELLAQRRGAEKEEVRTKPLSLHPVENGIWLRKQIVTALTTTTAQFFIALLCVSAIGGIGYATYVARGRKKNTITFLQRNEKRSVVTTPRMPSAYSPAASPVVPPDKKVADHVSGVDLELSTSKLLINDGGYVVPSGGNVYPSSVSAVPTFSLPGEVPKENVRKILSLVGEKMAKKDDALAERVLIDAINKCPKEPLLYVKLFEIYAINQLITQAFSIMDTIHKLTLGEGAAWQMLLNLSKQHGIDHPYMSKKPETAHPPGKVVPVKKMDFAKESTSVALDQEL